MHPASILLQKKDDLRLEKPITKKHSCSASWFYKVCDDPDFEMSSDELTTDIKEQLY